ncbi:MAG: hypothetical protein O7H39_05160 [Gammaproteobacteria bacterium]|nr:hypothetical protein [Gammaproteobacteria bacterium]
MAREIKATALALAIVTLTLWLWANQTATATDMATQSMTDFTPWVSAPRRVDEEPRHVHEEPRRVHDEPRRVHDEVRDEQSRQRHTDPIATTSERLRDLRIGSTLAVPDPEGGNLDLSVYGVVERGAFTLIKLRSNGLSSQITVARSRYMATIATPRGSYHVNDLDDPTSWILQRTLNQKSDPNLPDFRRVPVT